MATLTKADIFTQILIVNKIPSLQQEVEWMIREISE